MRRAALVCMPFAAADLPPLGVSVLKPLLQRVGIPCDVQYLNLRFRDFTGSPNLYDGACGPSADWVFSEALSGPGRDCPDRGEPEGPYALPEPDDPDFPTAMLQAKQYWCLTRLRLHAASFLDHAMKTVPWEDYGLIGFSLVFTQTVASLALARRIKERWPDKVISLGGPACDGDMGTALLRLFPFVDWVFSGEADLSFPQAALRWSEGRSPQGIQGVAHRENGRVVAQGAGGSIDLNELPYPDFDDYFSALRQWAPDALPEAALSIELSRGCWWAEKRGCVFCGLNRTTRRYRRKDPDRVRAEITALRSRYGVEKVHCTDTVLDTRAFETVLATLEAKEEIGTLYVETRPTLERRQLSTLRRAGVRRFQPGIESLDTSILTHMHKGTSLAANVQLLKGSREVGLVPHWGFLYGFPGEDREAYLRMASLVPALVHLTPPDYVIPVRLHRFSPLFEHSKAWGLRDIRAARLYRSLYPFDQQDLDQLAYDFDFDFDGRQDVAGYTRQVRRELRAWQECWQRGTPPLLAFEREDGETIVLRDTRPCRRSARVRLVRESAIAYLACDGRQRLADITRRVKQTMGKRYPGDVAVDHCLEDLVSQRLMLRDGPWYLSLAIDLAATAEHAPADLTSASRAPT